MTLHLTPTDRDSWAAYEAANARAADMYEAIPTSHRRGGLIPRCACGAVSLASLCRVCRAAKGAS